MAQFLKFTDKDFESKSQHITTDKTFNPRICGQHYVALNIANISRRPVSKLPGFRIIEIYSSISEASEALSESRAEGCDGSVCQIHTPLLLSETCKSETETESSDLVKIQHVLAANKLSYIQQKN